MVPSKGVHILIFRTWENVTIHGNRNFADVIKDIEIGDYPGGPNVITRFTIRGRQDGYSQKKEVW